MSKTVALVGNPNVGKSTIFNLLTGLNQKIGNYPGVTVDKKYGSMKLGDEQVEVVDLPGTYSIHPKTEDEKVVYDFLTKSTPDLVIVVADAANLKRNLLLFTQVYDLKIPVLLVLNRIDLAQKDNQHLSAKKVSELLGGISVVSLDARKGNIEALKSEMSAIQTNENWQPFFHSNGAKDYLNETEARYEKIDKLLKFLHKEKANGTASLSAKMDRILIHKVWGYVIFLGILFVIFQFIYELANVPMDLIDAFFVSSSSALSSWLPPGPLTSLLVEGLIPGIGGVVIFIPQIAFLFLFLTLLEESGYMTRVVFLMDRIMRPFGLHGKSIVPLMSGVACAIPAIMSSRSIDHPKERLITILVSPLISCSARLPVYILLIALVVPSQSIGGIINMQGLALFAMYILGGMAALLFGMIFKALLITKSSSFLIMEMPRYQMPRLRNVALNVYEKSKSFVWGAGRIIVSISIILWVLGSYGPASFDTDLRQESKEIIPQTSLESSFIGIVGKQIEPVISPLGYDWKIGISLITSFAAREVFVGTMATIYSIDEEVNMESGLLGKMNQEINPKTGERRYGLATGFSLMIFYAFAMQCMSTLAVTKRETKSWKWPLVQLGYMTTLAYLSALITYQVLS